MAKRNNEAKSYLGAPEPVTDDWTACVQQYKHIFLANGVTEDGPKLHLFLALVGTNTFQLFLNLTVPQAVA